MLVIVFDFDGISNLPPTLQTPFLRPNCQSAVLHRYATASTGKFPKEWQNVDLLVHVLSVQWIMVKNKMAAVLQCFLTL
jgi:hypothetical protein